jgi:ribosomal protein S11
MSNLPEQQNWERPAPGSWRANGTHVELTNDPWTYIAVAYDGRDGVVLSKSQQTTVACQIAALPDLWEALDALLKATLDVYLAEGFELTEVEQQAREKALAAMAKAAGKEAM